MYHVCGVLYNGYYNMLKDILGNEVHAGDYVIYAVRGVKYGDPLRMGIIDKVTERCAIGPTGEKRSSSKR